MRTVLKSPVQMATLLSMLASSLLLSGCVAESAPAHWLQSESGRQGLYQAHLDCETPPATGPFQQCEVRFTDSQGRGFIPVQASIEGGMPLHGHGLPTAPVLSALEQPGHYRIDGLKYNMPGAWLLGFQVNGPQGEDRLVFDFVI
ncbi:MAG: hypothetical protein R3E89_10905 [Thiolinea sp.]